MTVNFTPRLLAACAIALSGGAAAITLAAGTAPDPAAGGDATHPTVIELYESQRLFELPAGQCQRQCYRRPARRARAAFRGDLLGPARLEGQFRQARFYSAAMGLCPRRRATAGGDAAGRHQWARHGGRQ